MTFIFQLNTAMIPRKISSSSTSPNQEGKEQEPLPTFKEWKLNDASIPRPPIVQNLASLLEALATLIDSAPPDPGPRRFGNISFRTWYSLVEDRVPDLLTQHLPPSVLSFKTTSGTPAQKELEAYLLGSFGSAQRLDYGTGHELSFLAFLGCLWKLGAFPVAEKEKEKENQDGDMERGIVLGVLEPYLALIRRLILTYTLEPAGSHGVWGLDDHSFLPYIFGSAQFSPPIVTPADVAAEGSLHAAPHPGDVAKAAAVARERSRNMYFSAIGFIYDVKKGPFWEHSNILYDVSGVKAGWAKINKGMIKMYNAEVLSKFPVVQHFPFGSLFSFTPDPTAKKIQATVHTASQPKHAVATPSSTAPTQRPQPVLRDPMADPTSTAASMGGGGGGGVGTAAPWARGTTAAGPGVPSGVNQPTRAPWAGKQSLDKGEAGEAGTRAPWAGKR
ncbi:serine/threonine-protein phosphatase 2A activator 1 [Stemphylium lycopersici]|uniref:Serine/threonine-protein phosphatase 2A activator n=1 Tax=Stemphylium lycopersici TaxID=183478 RepID=A0A364N5E0_STELY|nr:serine/threonine-protein phosphatase 2A activator 1 [Stemphylium lycopersici]